MAKVLPGGVSVKAFAVIYGNSISVSIGDSMGERYLWRTEDGEVLDAPAVLQFHLVFLIYCSTYPFTIGGGD